MNENENSNGSFEPKPTKAPNNKKALIIIVAVALVAIIAIIGAAIASKSSKKTKESTNAATVETKDVVISTAEMNGAKISNVTKRGNNIEGTVEYDGSERGFEIEFYADSHNSTHQNIEVYIKDVDDSGDDVDVEIDAYCEDCYNAGEEYPSESDYISFSKDETTAKSTTKETTTKETTTKATTTKATTTKETTTKSSVDIRKIADDFDEWVDSYVAFMKKVEEDSSYMVSHYSEYTEFMSDYTKWLDDMASYDEDDFSASDWAYFWAKYTEALAKLEKM